jgi:hypothetical protein
MHIRVAKTVGAIALGAALASVIVVTVVGAVTSDSKRTLPFEDARLKIEFNATDGDAGLQIFADSEDGWREIAVRNPAGGTVAQFTAGDVIKNFGLTELFSESSEPPFTELPFEEFKQLFPEGKYTFEGVTIDGDKLGSTFTFTHDVPDAPNITSPADGSTVDPNHVVVTWDPVTTPASVKVVAYEVIVISDEPAPSGGERTVDVILPASTNHFPVPAEFLTPGDYKTEVLAIDNGGNQTLSEIPFSVE